ncbi:hypothetical protein [uncultured Roseobacter sp.]|uniref:hypothetical protein n=1 Tax=uncultured Roseobacter sp. TaxID=114847 RepID=UPI0026254926|nr:hypothetical protein [uncultured Roseobacter sp.]
MERFQTRNLARITPACHHNARNGVAIAKDRRISDRQTILGHDHLRLIQCFLCQRGSHLGIEALDPFVVQNCPRTADHKGAFRIRFCGGNDTIHNLFNRICVSELDRPPHLHGQQPGHFRRTFTQRFGGQFLFHVVAHQGDGSHNGDHANNHHDGTFDKKTVERVCLWRGAFQK